MQRHRYAFFQSDVPELIEIGIGNTDGRRSMRYFCQAGVLDVWVSHLRHVIDQVGEVAIIVKIEWLPGMATGRHHEQDDQPRLG